MVRRSSLALAGFLTMICAIAPVRAQTAAPLGVYENARTGVLVEFTKNGQVIMNGSAPTHFEMCGQAGGNICITGAGFTCHYRARIDGKAMTLQLFTGRPTKECPEGVFRLKDG